MGKYRKIVVIVLSLAGIVALLYWQFNKKQIIHDAIQSAVVKGSDSIYTIRYDSSYIDEVSGNATFFNLRLQSDSLYRLLRDDSTRLQAAIVSVYVSQLRVLGVNIPGLLTQNKIEAREIEIERPIIKIVLPPGDTATFSSEDSVNLYNRLTGNFNSIRAGKISVRNGQVLVATGLQPERIGIKGIHLSLTNLDIDSTKDYTNIISYFIRELEAGIDTVILLPKKSNRSIRISGVKYSAPSKELRVDQYSASYGNNPTSQTDIRDITFTNLSTENFINRHEISADTLSASGGKIHIELETGGKESDISKQIVINNDYFNKVHINNLRFGKTDVTLAKKDDKKAIAKAKALTLQVSDINSLEFSFNLPWMLSNSNWKITGNSLDLPATGSNYKTEIGSFVLDKPSAIASFDNIQLQPLQTDEEFMRQQKEQKDHYRLKIANLRFTGLQFDDLLQKKISASRATLQPDIYIYNDRTLPPDLSSKVGRYPQQLFQKVSIPINIHRLEVINGKVVYRERGAISGKTGDVLFSGINATISNLSNKNSGDIVMNADGSFLGVAPLTTTWRFPMEKKNGSFSVSATIKAADARKFNSVTEPLGMAKIKSGDLKKLQLNMKGDDYGSAGSLTVLYNNLKIIYLEEPKEGDSINRKTLLTFFANIFTKDDNPSNGRIRSNSVGIQRDTTRSFFNLIWKSIFEGVKKTAAGKSM